MVISGQKRKRPGAALTAHQPWPFTVFLSLRVPVASTRVPVEIVLIVAAAGGLLGCFASVARVDVNKSKHQLRRPAQRVVVR
jgi:hypothetical protein